MRVAVQPCGDSFARAHYVDTIKNLVPRSRVEPHLTPDQLADFMAVCGSSTAVWGVTPGKRGQNKTKWKKLRPGDVALLYRKRAFFSQGKIILCMHNASLAEDLWGRNEDGETWEYLYFLDELQEIDVPLKRYQSALGYKPKQVVQGFGVHEGTEAELLLEVLELKAEDVPEMGAVSRDASTADLQAALAALPTTDLPSLRQSRQESGIFRTHLFGRVESAKCDICRRELPTGLLVAAHIKPRASCTDSERRDLSVVMRACRLGCDELYERGYIHVDAAGHVQGTNGLMRATADLKAAAAGLTGKKCVAHSPRTADYFKWHRDRPKRYLA